MTFQRTGNAPSIPEVLPRFERWHERHRGWGPLEPALGLGNVSDACISSIKAEAVTRGDLELVDICGILLGLEFHRRAKIGMVVSRDARRAARPVRRSRGD